MTNRENSPKTENIMEVLNVYQIHLIYTAMHGYYFVIAEKSASDDFPLDAQTWLYELKVITQTLTTNGFILKRMIFSWQFQTNDE